MPVSGIGGMLGAGVGGAIQSTGNTTTTPPPATTQAPAGGSILAGLLSGVVGMATGQPQPLPPPVVKQAPEPPKDNTILIFAVIVFLLIVGLGMYFLLRK